jgi:hypothetical protein
VFEARFSCAKQTAENNPALSSALGIQRILGRKERNEMLLGGLGVTEIIVLSVVLLVIALPIVGTIALVVFLTRRRKNSDVRMKQCAFCAEWIQAEARVCRFCSRDLAQ